MENKSSQRNILITGGNKGIGYAIIEKLLESATPYNIIITSRDPNLGQEAVKKLQNKHANSSSTLIYHKLDVNNDKEIQEFIDWLQTNSTKIDVLVNNAGVNYHYANLEQRQKTIQTNFTSVVNLTEKLIPYLTDDAKVINMSSILASFSVLSPSLRAELQKPNLTEQDLQEIVKNIENYHHDFNSTMPVVEASYCASKGLVNAYTHWVLPKKLKPTQQCYAVAPGWCQTDMGGAEADLPVEAGADTPVYLIELPFVKNDEINAKFLEKRQVIPF